jgi:hypothetical protein
MKNKNAREGIETNSAFPIDSGNPLPAKEKQDCL